MKTYTGDVIAAMDRRSEEIWGLSQRIWEHPEVALEESYASGQLTAYLEQQGFQVESGIAGMETAFVATWGSGAPVIGFLGEYDALPNMSQALKPERDQIEPGGPGHACGHNLLGAAMAGAAASVKEILECNNLPGTVRFYGCPAEEIMVGKIKMDAEHAFDGCDVCLCWHPMGCNCVANYSYAAMTSVKFHFQGVMSHAAEAPDQGRSALDAVELMNVAANYLREHMLPQARIHYVITNGGGKPNVVPPEAESWYFVRAPYKKQVDALVQRLIKIQEGAALMTETTASYRIESGCYNTIANTRLNELLYQSLHRVPMPEWSEEDEHLAQELLATLPQEALDGTLKSFDIRELKGEALHKGVVPLKDEPSFLAGSTDISNVSRTVPTGQVFTCCVPVGVPGHTWQTTVSVGSEIGRKGMLYAASVIADTAMVLYTEPEELVRIRADFEKATADL